MNKNINIKIYPLLATLVVFFQLMCFIYARRKVDILGFPVNVSGIIFPLDIYLIEIIGECYGFQFARQIVWINLTIHAIFIFFVLATNSLPYSSLMHTDLVFSYKHLIAISWVSALGSLIFNFMADMFSARFIANTKVLFEGKYMFARLFISQTCSEIIVTLSYFVSFLTNGYTVMFTVKLIGATIIVKSIMAFIMYPFARIMIYLIKQKENFNAYDLNLVYKIFSFSIHLDNIQFFPIKNKRNTHEKTI